MLKKNVIVMIFLFLTAILSAQDKWPYLDNHATLSDSFIKEHPSYDGRGVIIFVLDCGVDPLIPGLLRTTEGKTKVVDSRDFSNQLSLSLKLAEIDSSLSERPLTINDTKVFSWKNLSLKPEDDKYYLGSFKEKHAYRNSAVQDINNNTREDDEVLFLAFKTTFPKEIFRESPGLVKPDSTKAIWVYYVDEDGDGHMDDEKPKFEYKYRFDTFNFQREGSKTNNPVTFSAHFEGKKLIICGIDGSHGTHCAGIAAGNDIFGQEGHDGIAPGAYVVNLKIGNNALSGGATTCESMKKAYEYGVDFMKEAGFDYGVFSMSYGIGSETPGKSSIEKFLNRFAVEHPEAVIVTSMGNEGPGINSTGNPAGAARIISVGAMVPASTLKDLYGSSRQTDWVTYFSSRGGETGKPDVVAPGGASATVPNFSKGDVKWGTSMSCPQVAGICALLLSAAQQENIPVNSFLIKKALKHSAVPMTGYTSIDYGSGLAQTPQAFRVLKKISKGKYNRLILDYEIETTNTFYPDLKGPALFWKSNGFYPTNEKIEVKVTPVFHPEATEQEKESFYGDYRLKLESPWVSTDKSRVYIRGKNQARFNIILTNKSKISGPGLYLARIQAIPTNFKRDGNCPEFEIPVSAVIPFQNSSPNSPYHYSLSNQTLTTGEIKRIFTNIPPGASAMNAALKPRGNNWFHMGFFLFAPDGSNPLRAYSRNPKTPKEIIFQLDSKEMDKGIWELLPYCHYQSLNASYYDLDLDFYSLDFSPDTIKSFSIRQGKNPIKNFKVFQNEQVSYYIKYTGKIEGCQKTSHCRSKGKEEFREKITIGKDIESVEIKIQMHPKEYNKVTDLAVNIVDNNGKVLKASGMSRKELTMTFSPPESGEYELQMVPAFTSAKEKKEEWKFTITEKHFFKSPIGLSFKKNNAPLIPGVWTENKVETNKDIPVTAENWDLFGKITLTNKQNNHLMGKIHILLTEQ